MASPRMLLGGVREGGRWPIVNSKLLTPKDTVVSEQFLDSRGVREPQYGGDSQLDTPLVRTKNAARCIVSAYFFLLILFYVLDTID